VSSRAFVLGIADLSPSSLDGRVRRAAEARLGRGLGTVEASLRRVQGWCGCGRRCGPCRGQVVLGRSALTCSALPSCGSLTRTGSCRRGCRCRGRRTRTACPWHSAESARMQTPEPTCCREGEGRGGNDWMCAWGWGAAAAAGRARNGSNGGGGGQAAQDSSQRDADAHWTGAEGGKAAQGRGEAANMSSRMAVCGNGQQPGITSTVYLKILEWSTSLTTHPTTLVLNMYCHL
jgi:hypothetical protein